MTELLLHLLPWTLHGPVRAQNLYVATLALLVVGTMLSLGAVRYARLDVAAVAVAGAGAAGWLLSNGPAEGGTLVIVADGNGLTLADLAAVPALALAAGLCWRRARA